MIDLGDTAVLTYTVLTPGTTTPVTPASISLSITQPDGTILTPAPTLGATGVYTYNFVTVQSGRHAIRWTTTGPATAYADVLNVEKADPGFIISLADARSMLRLQAANTINDEQLRIYLAATTAVVEDVIGPQIKVTKTQVCDGGYAAVILHAPPVAITSITESGAALTANADFTVDFEHGIIWRGTFNGGYIFTPGRQNVIIVYTTGGNVPSTDVRLACGIILNHLWQADQQGYFNRPPLADLDITVSPSGFALPNRAAELLSPSQMRNMPGFA